MRVYPEGESPLISVLPNISSSLVVSARYGRVFCNGSCCVGHIRTRSAYMGEYRLRKKADFKAFMFRVWNKFDSRCSSGSHRGAHLLSHQSERHLGARRRLRRSWQSDCHEYVQVLRLHGFIRRDCLFW